MDDMFATSLIILIALLSISLVIAFLRLYLGPNPPNRTVAFDLIALHAAGIMALFAVLRDAAVMLDAVIITAVLGFLGTVMIALYLDQTSHDDWRQR
jgi:multisubunit Na+/H+ antiporter MnhF subunit